MSEGGEARNHEAAEAEVERILGPYSSVLTPSIVAERIVAAVLDAVRCAQGRDTDAPDKADVLLTRSLRAHHGIVPAPQGEDHEAGIQAALHAFDDAAMGAFDSLRDEEWPEHAMRQAIAAYQGELLDGETK